MVAVIADKRISDGKTIKIIHYTKIYFRIIECELIQWLC